MRVQNSAVTPNRTPAATRQNRRAAKKKAVRPQEKTKTASDKKGPPQHQQTRKAPVVPKAATSPTALRALGTAAQKAAEPYVQTAKAGWSALKEQAQEGLRQVQEQVSPPLTEREQKAAKYMHAMLGPDKLGGNDRTFNHQDVDAIADGITDGGLRGALARGVVRNKLPQELDDAGVVKDPDAKPDDAARRVSSKQLQNFQKASAILLKRGENLERLGIKVVFPKGISQDAVTHLMEGKLGLPPGAKIEPLKSEWKANEEP